MGIRDVHFMGKVTDASIEKLKEKISSLYEKDSKEPIILYICSGGGATAYALGFYEWVRANNICLTTVAVGDVSSAAVTLFLSGQRRIVTKNSSFLIHPGGSVKSDLRDFLMRVISRRRYHEDKEWTKYYRFVISAMIAEKTKITKKDAFKALTKWFLFFDAPQAVKVGLANEII